MSSKRQNKTEMETTTFYIFLKKYALFVYNNDLIMTFSYIYIFTNMASLEKYNNTCWLFRRFGLGGSSPDSRGAEISQ